jgi:hypothetical protein
MAQMLSAFTSALPTAIEQKAEVKGKRSERHIVELLRMTLFQRQPQWA